VEEMKQVTDALESFKGKQEAALTETKAAVESVKSEVGTIKSNLDKVTEDLKKTVEATDKIQGDVKLFTIGGKHKDEKLKDLGTQVSERIEKNLEEIKSRKSGWITLSKDMDTKTAGTMTTSNIDAVGTNSIPYLLSDAEGGLTRIARRSPFIVQLCNVGTTNKTYVQWAEQANPDDGLAATTAEGAAKHQTDFDVVEKSQKVEKITAYIKVSTEMLDDVDFIRSEINQELVELIMLKLDEQVFKGDGTTPNLKGITQFAQAVSFGSLAGTVIDPSKMDVIRACAAQIATNQFTYPDYVLMHPEDAAQMDLEKTDDGVYVIPPFVTADRANIRGVRVIENTGVTAGQFLIGDFSKANVRLRKNLSISVGYENDDFTKNLVTIMAELRAVHYVKTNHANAFVYDHWSDGRNSLYGGS
jgi:HK97 family phage major capsid protein